MKILFVHQNFPAQFKFVAPSLATRGHDIRAMTMNDIKVDTAISLYKYTSSRSSTPNIHPWVGDFETKVKCFEKFVIRPDQRRFEEAVNQILKLNGYDVNWKLNQFTI